MNWKTASCIAWVVALTSYAGGAGSAGNPAVGTGGPISQSRQFDDPGELMLASDPHSLSIGGSNTCSPYQLIAYKDYATGCGGVLSVMPSSKDRVVYLSRGGSLGDPDPSAETAMGDSNHHGMIVEVTLEDVEATTLYAFNGRPGGGAGLGPLTPGSDVSFYGTTSSENAISYGSVFRMSITSVETVIYSFGAARLR